MWGRIFGEQGAVSFRVTASINKLPSMDLFPAGSLVSTNWSNTWKHACYCAFMYTFTEKHVRFHVISRFSAQFDPTGKGVASVLYCALQRICIPVRLPTAGTKVCGVTRQCSLDKPVWQQSQQKGSFWDHWTRDMEADRQGRASHMKCLGQLESVKVTLLCLKACTVALV